MSKGLKLTHVNTVPASLKLPSGVVVLAIIAVAILATSFSGFKPIAFATAVSSCSAITASGSYQLSSDLSAGSNICISIVSNNTELDCNNYWINGTNTNYLINISSNGTYSPVLMTNVTLHNCRFGYGFIIVQNATNVNISDNLFVHSSNGGAGIITFWPVNDSIIANNIISNVTGGEGIQFFDSINITVRNNTLNNLPRTGMRVQSVTYKFIDNFTIENNTFENTSGSTATCAIRFDGHSDGSALVRNSTISSNIIRNGLRPAACGILGQYYAQNFTIKYNFITNTSEAIDIIGAGTGITGAGNATIFGNIIIGNTGGGIVVQTDGGTTEFISNNTLINNSGTGVFGVTNTGGINVTGANVTVTNNTLINTGLTNAAAINVNFGGLGFTNISNNIIVNSSYGIRTVTNDNSIITGNNISYIRNASILIGTRTGNLTTINYNTLCYNNASIQNTTANYIVGNNTFCVDRIAPADGTTYSQATTYTVNVTNTFNTTKGQSTSCYLFYNGVSVNSTANIGQKLNTTINYTPTSASNWYVYCNDTFAFPNTGNSSVFTLLSPAGASPPSGGSSSGEVKLPPSANTTPAANATQGIVPPTEKGGSQTCPAKCNSPESTACVNSTQTRTVYKCSKETGYTCQPFTESRKCNVFTEVTDIIESVASEEVRRSILSISLIAAVMLIVLTIRKKMH